MLNHVCICICTSCLHLFYILLVFVLRQICCRQQHVLSLRQCVSVCQRCNAACHTSCIPVHHRALQCITVHYNALQCITVHHSVSQCITEQGVVIQKSALCICVIFVLPLVCISVTSHTNVSQGIAGLCNAEKWIECRTIRPFSDAACHVTVTWCTSRCIIVHQILLPFANVFQDVRICLGICFCIVFVICICVSDAPDASLFMRYCCTPQSFSGHSYFPRH